MLVGLLAAAVLWMHVLAGSGTHHGVALPDGGAGHGGPVTLVEGRQASAGDALSGHGDPSYASTGLGRVDGAGASGPDLDLSIGVDPHGSAGPLCLMVLVALVTLAARAALRRRAAWALTHGAVPHLELRAALPSRPPDLHALGISRT
ncbi:hypothetical protein M768_03695 [Cellulosimicrobium cellulans F16]|uniref:Uncharacterized protein n=1 Tax=Cellulosimicrobium cellulans F16 TaxID=1350482 RepID=A0A0M0FBU3_CELCE|nr:hypothetical protein [Cellulosimicrobium cellulans]KON75055.1 hypothetical protein M768_03695 [Cellulosimicrobium cellulans F16]